MNDLLNFHQITDWVATSGQPTVEQFKMIRKSGYEVVINLAMHDSDYAILEEGSVVASLGMNYIHIPVPFESPLASHLKDFFNVMGAFEGKKIFVHCALNIRVSAFIFKYQTLKKGIDSDIAKTPLLDKWLPSMDEKWKSIIGLTLEEIEL